MIRRPNQPLNRVRRAGPRGVNFGLQVGSRISGGVAGFQGIQQVAKLLRSYFLPASLGTPPGAQGNQGNRTIVHTSKTVQQTAQALVGGQLKWRFDSPFQKPPIISHIAEGAPGSGTPVIYIVKGSLTTKSVGIASTDSGDTRLVHLTASVPPS